MGRSGAFGGRLRSRLLGRNRECEALSSLIAGLKARRSQVLVLRGEAGIGKTALLEFLVDQAGGCQVRRAAGVESEMELAYAGVHQLCGPFLEHLDHLPPPQRAALGTAFGLHNGDAPDRFLVGVAVLTLLGVVANELPLLCVVEDAQWLDQASLQALQFVARRLPPEEPVALVFAVRDTDDEEPALVGLPGLTLRGLPAREAGKLLDVSVPGVSNPAVRERVLAESHGNPLALLELPRELSTAGLAVAGVGPAQATPAIHRIEQGFHRQLMLLSTASRRLLLAAAAEPVGDVPLLWRAVERLGLQTEAAGPAEAAGLIALGDRVRFCHPLLRSVVYRSATPGERREVHRALADVTDPHVDPDRRAWHLAQASVDADESVASELETAAERALAAGGVAAAAAFLEQAVALTPDPRRRLNRALSSARGKMHAGAFEDATALLAAAQATPLDAAARAQVDLLWAELTFSRNRGNGALPLLLAAARQLEALDTRLARDTYLSALSAALFVGQCAAGPGARDVAEAARGAPTPNRRGKADALLESLTVLFINGGEQAARTSHHAVRAFATEDLTLEEALRSSWLAAATAASLWDDACWDVLTSRHLELVRHAGALSALPLALQTRAIVQLLAGDLAAIPTMVDEARSVAEATGSTLSPYAEMALAAIRGNENDAEPLIQRCLEDATARGEGFGVNTARWTRAVLCNGLGRYGEAVAAAQAAVTDPCELGPPKWALAELVEAAARIGDPETASAALQQLSAMTRASGTDWALGVEASRRALLHDGPTADALYREAIERLGRTRMRIELARAQLLYGEWLRREGRRTDARAQLRVAHEALAGMGALAFASRAQRELQATGQTIRKYAVESANQLTAQEAHIARLVAEGLTNPEIGAALFISPRTVEWHLRKIFSKLGVSSRRQLRLSVRTMEGSTAST